MFLYDNFDNKDNTFNRLANITLIIYSSFFYNKLEIAYEGKKILLPLNPPLVSYIGNRFLESNNFKSAAIANYYLLTNSEFLFDTLLVGFTLNASTAGVIYISLRKHTPTCGTTISCAEYLSTVSTHPAFTTTMSWTFTVTLGFNRLELITPFQVTKGTLVFVDIAGFPAKVYIETNENLKYTDYVLSGTSLIRYHSTANYMLQLNSIIENPLYYYPLDLSLPFTYSKLQTVSFNFSSEIGYYNFTREYNITTSK